MNLPHFAKHAFRDKIGLNVQKPMPFGSPSHQGLKNRGHFLFWIDPFWTDRFLRCQTTIDSLRLGCAGHVARMDDPRLPRRFLISWVRAKRPTGRPRLSTAHCINDTIHRADLNTENWVHLANDRDEWRKLCRAVKPKVEKRGRRPAVLSSTPATVLAPPATMPQPVLPPPSLPQPQRHPPSRLLATMHDSYRMQAPCLLRKHRKQQPQPCFKGSNRHYTSQILKS